MNLLGATSAPLPDLGPPGNCRAAHTPAWNVQLPQSGCVGPSALTPPNVRADGRQVGVWKGRILPSTLQSQPRRLLPRLQIQLIHSLSVASPEKLWNPRRVNPGPHHARLPCCPPAPTPSFGQFVHFTRQEWCWSFSPAGLRLSLAESCTSLCCVFTPYISHACEKQALGCLGGSVC